MAAHPAQRALLEAIEAHFIAHLGTVLGRTRVETPKGLVEVRRYEPVAGSLVLATFGAACLDGGFKEGVIAIHAQPSEAITSCALRILAAFASLRPGEQAGLSFSPEAPVLAPFDFDSVLLLPPRVFTEGLSQLEAGPEHPPVEVVWLVPGFEEEAAYAAAHGHQSLFHLFDAQRTDPANFERSAASTLVSPEDAARMAGATPDGSDAHERGYRVEQMRGSLRIERRRKRIGREPASTQPMVPSSPPARPASKTAPLRPVPSAASRGKTAPGRPGSTRNRVRFELSDTKPAPAQEPAPPPKPAVPEDPVEAKRRRIEALKAKAQEARERAEARRRGEPVAEPESPAPPSSSAAERSRAVLAAERRRGRRTDDSD